MLLVAGVGYTHLGDLSFGPAFVERARDVSDAGVAVEDLSYGPIAVVDWLRDEPGRFERAIFVGAGQHGATPGTLSRSRWSTAQRPADEVQARIAEAVTGTISLENLLVIATHFGVLPSRTEVVELEPIATGWGEPLSAVAEERMAELARSLGWDLPPSRAALPAPAVPR